MNKILLLILAFTVSATLHAQDKTFPEKMENVKGIIDPATIAGLKTYDVKEVFTKLKIRKASTKNTVSGLIEDYNTDIKVLKGKNMKLLVKLGSDLKSIFTNKEFAGLWDARSDFKDQVNSVRKESKSYHDEFETKLLEALKKRKQKKWYKYKENIKTEAEKSFDIGDIFSNM